MHTTQQAIAAFDAAVSEVGVRNVLLADRLRGAFVRRLDALGSALEGWRLAPVESTDDMNRAAVIYANGNAVYKNVASDALKIEESIYGEVWSAMLAAAPQPPAAQQGEAVAISSGMCQRCGKWAGAHATLPGQPTDRLCRCQPAAAPQPVAQGDANPMTAHRAAWFLERFKREEKLLGPNERKALLFAIDALERLAAAPAGVVGEPVARVIYTDASLPPAIERLHAVDALPIGTHDLYTAPPARQALTPDQISEMEWGAACIGLAWDVRVSAVRAVERAHKIGGA